MNSKAQNDYTKENVGICPRVAEALEKMGDATGYEQARVAVNKDELDDAYHEYSKMMVSIMATSGFASDDMSLILYRIQSELSDLIYKWEVITGYIKDIRMQEGEAGTISDEDVVYSELLFSQHGRIILDKYFADPKYKDLVKQRKYFVEKQTKINSLERDLASYTNMKHFLYR